MSDFHKHFIQHMFQHIFEKAEGVESDQVAGSHFDIAAFGDKIALAKSANIDAMAFLQRCHDRDGKSVKECLAAFDAELAKIPPKK